MEGFEHACFISYRHPPDAAAPIKHIWIQFIEALEASLSSCLTRNRSIYRDNSLKAKPGVKYPPELARNLCKSACMIAVLVPEYQESSWCLAEWRAMEALEKSRSEGGAPLDLLIPVLYRGDHRQAQAFVGTRTLVDLRHIASPKSQLKTITHRRVMETLAARIDGAVRHLRPSPTAECEQFKIGDGPDAALAPIADPHPFS